MTRQLNKERIDELAVMYARTRSEEVLAELLQECRPLIENEARKAVRDCSLNYEDMVSEYTQDVWEAVKGDAALRFDGSSQFTQRFRSFFKLSLTDQIRAKTCKMRSAQEYSLERELRPEYYADGGEEPLYTGLLMVEASIQSVEDEYVGSTWVDETLAGFTRSNERDGLIIQMVYEGYEHTEIAHALGSPTYDANTRQLVSRAKARFKKYLAKQNPLTA